MQRKLFIAEFEFIRKNDSNLIQGVQPRLPMRAKDNQIRGLTWTFLHGGEIFFDCFTSGDKNMPKLGSHVFVPICQKLGFARISRITEQARRGSTVP